MASLGGFLGDTDLAEQAVQDAFAIADRTPAFLQSSHDRNQREPCARLGADGSAAAAGLTAEDELLAHAAFNARSGADRIGAPVPRFGYSEGERFWECIVRDGEKWQFIRVLAVGLAPHSDLASEDIEQDFERFAATLSDSYRLGGPLNANPVARRPQLDAERSTGAAARF